MPTSTSGATRVGAGACRIPRIRFPNDKQACAPLRGKHREAAGVYAAALRIAQDAEVRYLFRGVDVNRLNARYWYPDQPHKVVLQHLLERGQYIQA